MAAQISHIIAGEAALEKALSARGGENEAAGAYAATGEAADSFDFGCQGPDIFYHNRRTMPSGLHYGSLAHRRQYGSILAGAAASVPESMRRADSPLAAYVLGLATHAAVDRATHPFVIYFSGWARPSDPGTAKYRGCHPFLERLLDIGLLEARAGIRPAEFGLTKRLGPRSAAERASATVGEAGDDDDGGLVRIWSAGLRAAYPKATDKDTFLETRIANALADARHFYAMTDPAAAFEGRGETLGDWLKRLGRDDGRKVLSILYPARIPEGLDPMNLRASEWEQPSGDGRRSSDTYLDLIDAGTGDAARSIGLVLDFWEGRLSAAELASALGEGSLALRDASGQTQPPRISAPLPLSEAMDAEYSSHVDVSASTG